MGRNGDEGDQHCNRRTEVALLISVHVETMYNSSKKA